jgi:hypothetical protein
MGILKCTHTISVTGLLASPHRQRVGRRSRRCGDYRTEPRWQDHGLAGQEDSRYFNLLLHAGQYDMIPALAFSGLVCGHPQHHDRNRSRTRNWPITLRSVKVSRGMSNKCKCPSEEFLNHMNHL